MSSSDPGQGEFDPDLTAFWRHLPHAEIEQHFLRLVQDTVFLADPDLGNTMYIRDDYRCLLDTIIGLFASGRRKLVISGNPGIGKSWFGFFVLHYLATMAPDSPVVWESIRLKQRFLFSNGSASRGDLSSFGKVLNNRNAWCEQSGACSAERALSNIPQVHR